jgi:hypothetical protein
MASLVVSCEAFQPDSRLPELGRHSAGVATAAFKGLAALLGMMNSCASNVNVVNIDNGFGAGYVASLINPI